LDPIIRSQNQEKAISRQPSAQSGTVNRRHFVEWRGTMAAID